ncbi:hypothetical protein C8R46DRAFT_1035850 [Mycena filopes]|nr:hypothetical protein C8R46DRAFT_1035850 [Mycena filopes]
MATNLDEYDRSVPFQLPDDFPAESGGLLEVEITKNLERNANLPVAPRMPVVPPVPHIVQGWSEHPWASIELTRWFRNEEELREKARIRMQRGLERTRNSQGKPLAADSSMTLLIERNNRNAKNIRVKKFLREDEAHYRLYGSHKKDKQVCDYTGDWESLQEEMWQQRMPAHVRERQQRAYEALANVPRRVPPPRFPEMGHPDVSRTQWRLMQGKAAFGPSMDGPTLRGSSTPRTRPRSLRGRPAADKAGTITQSIRTTGPKHLLPSRWGTWRFPFSGALQNVHFAVLGGNITYTTIYPAMAQYLRLSRQPGGAQLLATSDHTKAVFFSLGHKEFAAEQLAAATEAATPQGVELPFTPTPQRTRPRATLSSLTKAGPTASSSAPPRAPALSKGVHPAPPRPRPVPTGDRDRKRQAASRARLMAIETSLQDAKISNEDVPREDFVVDKGKGKGKGKSKGKRKADATESDFYFDSDDDFALMDPLDPLVVALEQQKWEAIVSPRAEGFDPRFENHASD